MSFLSCNFKMRASVLSSVELFFAQYRKDTERIVIGATMDKNWAVLKNVQILYRELFAQCLSLAVSGYENLCFVLLAAEMIDPKAKSSNGSLSTFPWPLRQAHAQLRSSLSRHANAAVAPPTVPHSPPIGAPYMDSMQLYARTQQQYNNSCLSRNGHR